MLKERERERERESLPWRVHAEAEPEDPVVRLYSQYEKTRDEGPISNHPLFEPIIEMTKCKKDIFVRKIFKAHMVTGC